MSLPGFEWRNLTEKLSRALARPTEIKLFEQVQSELQLMALFIFSDSG